MPDAGAGCSAQGPSTTAAFRRLANLRPFRIKCFYFSILKSAAADFLADHAGPTIKLGKRPRQGPGRPCSPDRIPAALWARGLPAGSSCRADRRRHFRAPGGGIRFLGGFAAPSWAVRLLGANGDLRRSGVVAASGRRPRSGGGPDGGGGHRPACAEPSGQSSGGGHGHLLGSGAVSAALAGHADGRPGSLAKPPRGHGLCQCRRHGDRLAGWLWPRLENSQAVARAAPLVILLFASAAREHSRLDNNQELLALGTANRHSQSANVRRISVSFGPCSQSCSDAATPALAGVWRGEMVVAQLS